MEYMSRIATLLDEIASLCDEIGSVATTARNQYPQFDDFFTELSDISAEMIDTVVDAESITSLDLSDYD